MGLLLLILLLALLFGGLGFLEHALWIIAVVLVVVWAFGYLARGRGGP